MITDILEFNRKFTADGGALPYRTGKYPSRKLAVLSCMDTRLTELLPAALGLQIGEAKMIRNAGGRIVSPYDDTVRSLLVAVAELGAQEIMVIGHTDCGVCGMNWETVKDHLRARGVTEGALREAEENRENVDLTSWFTGFQNSREEIAATAELLRRHPLLPPDVAVYGFVMDTETGELIPA